MMKNNICPFSLLCFVIIATVVFSYKGRHQRLTDATGLQSQQDKTCPDSPHAFSNKMREDYSKGSPSTWDRGKRINYLAGCVANIGGEFDLLFARRLSKELGGDEGGCERIVDSIAIPVIKELYDSVVAEGVKRTTFVGAMNPDDIGYRDTTFYNFEKLLLFEVVRLGSENGGVLFNNTEKKDFFFHKVHNSHGISYSTFYRDFLVSGQSAMYDLSFNKVRYRNAFISESLLKHKYSDCTFKVTLIAALDDSIGI